MVLPKESAGQVKYNLKKRFNPLTKYILFEGEDSMNYLLKISATAIFAATLTACSGASTQKGPDLGAVLDRTIMALEYAEAELEKPTADAEASAQMDVFTSLLHQSMNFEPKFYKKPVGIKLREDAAFVGFADLNGNNVVDAGEKDIFTVEIDGEQNRIIATDVISGEGTYRLSGSGLLTGYFIGRLLTRQRRSGVKPSSFANRSVKSSADYRKSRPAPKARSRSRSGSARAGK